MEFLHVAEEILVIWRSLLPPKTNEWELSDPVLLTSAEKAHVKKKKKKKKIILFYLT
jgi:hypothetical protein